MSTNLELIWLYLNFYLNLVRKLNLRGPVRGGWWVLTGCKEKQPHLKEVICSKINEKLIIIVTSPELEAMHSNAVESVFYYRQRKQYVIDKKTHR